MRKASKNEKALEAEISLVRFTSGSEQGWSLRIEDSSSGCQMIEARLSDEQMGQLLGGRLAKTPIRYWANPNIGKTQEHVRILVPLTHEDFRGSADVLDFKVNGSMGRAGYPRANGWTPETLDHFNGHRSSPEGYEVSLHRYVDPS